MGKLQKIKLVFVYTFLLRMLNPAVEAARILPPYYMLIVIGDKKGSGESLLCILSYEKTWFRRGWEYKVFLKPKCLVLATLILMGI